MARKQYKIISGVPFDESLKEMEKQLNELAFIHDWVVNSVFLRADETLIVILERDKDRE